MAGGSRKTRRKLIANTAIHIVPALSNEGSGPSYWQVRLCESLIDAATGLTLAGDMPQCKRALPIGI